MISEKESARAQEVHSLFLLVNPENPVALCLLRNVGCKTLGRLAWLRPCQAGVRPAVKVPREVQVNARRQLVAFENSYITVGERATCQRKNLQVYTIVHCGGERWLNYQTSNGSPTNRCQQRCSLHSKDG